MREIFDILVANVLEYYNVNGSNLKYYFLIISKINLAHLYKALCDILVSIQKLSVVTDLIF